MISWMASSIDLPALMSRAKQNNTYRESLGHDENGQTKWWLEAAKNELHTDSRTARKEVTRLENAIDDAEKEACHGVAEGTRVYHAYVPRELT